MTIQLKHIGPTKHIGIDVCSGPSLSRAERMAQVAARFARPTEPAPDAPKAAVEQADARLPAGE